MLASQIEALMQGRGNVAEEDVRAIALPALRHRLILNFEGEAEGIQPDNIIQDILKSVPLERK